jgi:hypothetical protein
MTLTWREIVAWLEFSYKLDRIDRANHVMTTAYGTQGDKQSIDKVVKELTAS